jgi:hypothetical protein
MMWWNRTWFGLGLPWSPRAAVLRWTQILPNAFEEERGKEELVGAKNRAINRAAPERDLADYLVFARARAETSDTRQWVSDLEDLLRVAWCLMTPEQRSAFRGHPDVLALVDAVGGGSAAV